MTSRFFVLLALLVCLLCACSTPRTYDLVIRNGQIYDGSGEDPYRGDVAIEGDRIVAVGRLGRGATGKREIDAQGMAVAPGFINMLSWATESLIEDPKSQSDIRQGVTLEVMGEGWSMGPVNDGMRAEMLARQDSIRYPVEWTTLDGYLQWLAKRGTSCNIASYVGATTLRIHEIGYDDRPPTAEELDRMRGLVRQAMEQGAMGIGSSMIYAPAFYASTEELIELCKVAAEYGGSYITHMRSEGNRLLEAVDEVLRIARESGIAAEIYHLKAAGRENWPKMDAVIEKVEQAQDEGVAIRADMYNYTAGATGLNAAMPPWVQEGGFEAWVGRLRDPEIRARVVEEMRTPTDEWENLYLAAGSAENVLLSGFKNPELKPYIGKTLSEVAQLRGQSPEDTMIDLVIEDGTRVETVYFLMSEENVEKQIRLPWVSFGSDAGSMAPEGVFLDSNPHPRAYGNFARLLGRYVRDRGVISLQEAVRRLTSLPADNLKIRLRGRLADGYYADFVIFDPQSIQDHASFAEPHQYSTGMQHVFVNGVQVLENGEHTGATPGRVVRGPGWKAP